MKHPNAELLGKMYSNFSEGNYEAMMSVCPDKVTFQLMGKSPLAGKYNKENFVSEFGAKIKDLSSGTYHFEAHDVMASDLHGIVLGTSTVTLHGNETQLRTVHVWRFENGKPIAGYEYPRDLYQFDATWGA